MEFLKYEFNFLCLKKSSSSKTDIFWSDEYWEAACYWLRAFYCWIIRYAQELHLWSFCPLWTEFMCIFTFCAEENVFPQESHLWSFWPLWTELMCIFKYCAEDNVLLHESHLWPFCSLWTELICVFKCTSWKKALPHESHLWSFCP